MVFLSFLSFAVMVLALIDIITRRDDQVKHLPKLVWVILVIILPLVGSVIWFAVGREYDGAGIPMRRERPARPAAPAAPVWSPPTERADMRTTEQQIADLDREIEEWRLREEIAKRRQERGEATAE